MRPRTVSLLVSLVFLPALCPATRAASQPKARYPTVQVGLASWYGAEHQGRTTASGEPFDPHKFTAAHRTWPLGTTVMVTNLRNGRSVVVSITDRGPAIRRRIIDLSKAAAERLGFVDCGLTPVEVRIIRTRVSVPQDFDEDTEETQRLDAGTEHSRKMD